MDDQPSIDCDDAGRALNRDRGSASVVVAGLVALGTVLALGIVSVGQLMVASSRAGRAADAAALAAAPVTFAPFGARGTATEEANRLAEANGAVLVRCECPTDRSWAPRTVEVHVVVSVSLLGIGFVEVPGSSRASFTPSALLGGD